MIVSMNLKTREQTIIEPMDESDIEEIEKIMIALYHQYQKKLADHLKLQPLDSKGIQLT